MAIIILNHDVKDFATWKPYYDADSNRRTNLGLKEIAVGTKSDNPKKVYMIWEGDPAKLDKMINDPELKDLMDEAGVISRPDYFVINT